MTTLRARIALLRNAFPPDLAASVARTKRGLPLRTVEAFARAHPAPEVVAALDVGDEHVGLALADPMQAVAMAYRGQLPTRSADGSRQLAAVLRVVFAQNGVRGVVVGYPITVEGQLESSQCLKTLRFLQLLQQPETRVPIASILLVNEQFSTSAARDILAERGVRKARLRRFLDNESAVLQLQYYLDMLQFEDGLDGRTPLERVAARGGRHTR